MLRVDLERREIAASVRELAEWPPGPPRPGGWLAQARAELGNEVHREYRRRRAREIAGFESEVAVSLSREVDGFTVSLRGRLDGRFEDAAGPVIEEVKSSLDPRPAHFLQLRLYALCLASENPSARLVLPRSGRVLEVACEFDRTRHRLDALVRALVAAARREAERAVRRAVIARSLRFPYPRTRPGQQELMDGIARGLEAGRPVLAEAPTGIGKTVAALLPALRYALENNARLFFATAKTTQQKLAARTFLDLAADGLRAVTLRAKARMCPTGKLLCHRDHCPYLENYLDEAQRCAALATLGSAHPDPEEIYAAGAAARVCPHGLALALVPDADVVIGDYNYLYAPSVAMEWGERRTVVVVDEAHNLFDRARECHSPFLERAALDSWTDFGPGAVFLARARSLLGSENADVEAWEEFARESARLTVEYARWRGPVPPDDRLLDVLQTVARIRDLLVADEPEFVFHRNAEGAGVLCVNPARRLAERHEEALGTVALSATLSPLRHYEEVLGFRRACGVRCPSPFPEEFRRVLVVPTVSTTYRARANHYGAIADTIARVAAVRPGHYAAYFPSFAFLDEVRSRLSFEPVLVQRPRMTERDRIGLLARMRDDSSPLLLLAVMGGIFAEGIDLPGEGLVGAIVVGPGLPQVGFERSEMQRYFDETCGRGFQHAMLYPGMQRVIQAAGRVHRTPRDKGVIVLLDRRFAQRPYSACFPAHWYRYDPAELVAENPIPALEAFWGMLETEEEEVHRAYVRADDQALPRTDG